MSKKYALRAKITNPEVCKRDYIITILGSTYGEDPAKIKQMAFDLAYPLAQKIPGAQEVIVSLARGGRSDAKAGIRTGAHRVKRAKSVGRGRYKRTPETIEKMRRTRASHRRRHIDKTRSLTPKQVELIFYGSNGKLDRDEKNVISHLRGWGVKKLSRRETARALNIPDLQVRNLARNAFTKLGVEAINNGFQALP